MLTYESATELLHLNLEEEIELKILSEAAALRLRWRQEQVVAFYVPNFKLSFLCITIWLLMETKS